MTMQKISPALHFTRILSRVGTSEHWYFVTKIVLTYYEKNCSSDPEKLLKFKAEGPEFANFLTLLEHSIQAVKGQNNFWCQNAFSTCSWRFLRSQKI